MAKFRDAEPAPAAVDTAAEAASRGPAPPLGTSADGTVRPDRSIGDILAELRQLTAEQVEHVLARQKADGLRFGEAAVALGLASNDDVLFALAQQFHYPYVAESQRATAPELVALNQPFSLSAEYFRALRTQVMLRVFNGEGQGELRCGHSLAVLSRDAGDGKTYCAANLAVSLAQLGGKTLIVDANMRNPRLQDVFGISNRTGLSGILSGRSDTQVIQPVDGVPSLFMLPVGTLPPNPLELLERPAFGLLMRDLAAQFDYVVVDTPAAVSGSDANVVVARCTAALLVARKNFSRIAALQDLAASLAGGPARIAGVVINER
jgi:chain length determinant protein tyrosine kinase EpsG